MSTKRFGAREESPYGQAHSVEDGVSKTANRHSPGRLYGRQAIHAARETT
jgi:hypothetical protein